MTNNETLTADTITDNQIRALRAEAAAVGDEEQVRLCDLALGRVQGANAGAEEDARLACAEAINAARAMEG